MHEQKEVLDWLDGVCHEAANDVTLASKIAAQSTALAHYFMNVTKLGSLPRDAWPHYYPVYFQEADRLYGEYLLTQEQRAQVAKIATLEEKLALIEKHLRVLVEAQTPKQQAKIAEAIEAADAPAEPDPAQTDGDAPEEPDEAPAEPAAEVEKTEDESADTEA